METKLMGFVYSWPGLEKIICKMTTGRYLEGFMAFFQRKKIMWESKISNRHINILESVSFK